MASERTAFCVFCDDLRAEVGNKLSLMGMYSGDLILQNIFPTFLPKFAIAVWVISDINDPLERLTTKVILPDGKELLSVESLAPLSIQNQEGALKLVMSQMFPIAPMPIPCEGMLEVWIETEREKLRAGRLLIHTVDQPPSD